MSDQYKSHESSKLFFDYFSHSFRYEIYMNWQKLEQQLIFQNFEFLIYSIKIYNFTVFQGGVTGDPSVKLENSLPVDRIGAPPYPINSSHLPSPYLLFELFTSIFDFLELNHSEN